MPKLLIMLLAALTITACADAPPVTAPVEGPLAHRSSDNDGSDDSDDGGDDDDGRATRLYDVTITNLTASQPFSPGVIITHHRRAKLFAVGARASEGIRLIAENGDPAVAVNEQTGRRGVFDVVTVAAPIGCLGCPGPFGSSATYRVRARAGADRLSLAIMLICTNDGFTGVHGVELPDGFRPVAFLTAGYDAGTEANDERSTSIVDPCFAIGPTAGAADGNARTATAGVIVRHAGTQGGADLAAATHGWQDPVARITVQRVRARG
jgi:hypothetical protein